MKKILTQGGLTLLALLLVVACQKDEAIYEGTSLLQGVVITAELNGGGSNCSTLFAGQTNDIGDVCVTVSGDVGSEVICITYNTTGAWTMNETHLWVGDDLADMPQSRKGNPKIGNFPYNSGEITGETSYTQCIPVSELTGDICNSTLFVAAHTAVQKENGDGTIDSETAWGSGESMVERGSWATYSSLTFNCNNSEEPKPETGNCETAFAYGGIGATCFLNIDEDGDGRGDFNRWGWTNLITESGTYTFDTYAGAGQCDINKGTYVGNLTVVYDESAGTATVTFATTGGFTMDETHLYVGNELLATNNGEFTVAPGQYPIVDEDVDPTSNTYIVEGLSGDIYVVAHSVVCGDFEAEPVDPPVYILSEFVASGAEVWPGLPSDLKDLDTRAGSLEINTNGGYGYNGGTVIDPNRDPAYDIGIVSLRNGTGQIVEQRQVNRRWPPALNADGCNPARLYPECWIWADDPPTDLVVHTPDRSLSSNDGFDATGSGRVTVEGGLRWDYSEFTGMDNGHQIITATWSVPEGRDLSTDTQLLFRGRYDWECNNLGVSDEWLVFFRMDGANHTNDTQLPGVTILENTANRVTIEVNVQQSLEAIRDEYIVRGFDLESNCQ